MISYKVDWKTIFFKQCFENNYVVLNYVYRGSRTGALSARFSLSFPPDTKCKALENLRSLLPKTSNRTSQEFVVVILLSLPPVETGPPKLEKEILNMFKKVSIIKHLLVP